MSSDSQLRKRKDNKKKRKDDEPQNEDINIHIHKEGGTGGGICAKIVFIVLSCSLVVLIGLIIKENQGLTELESIESESRFAQAFEGWIEENVADHSPEVLSDEHEDHDEEGSEETDLDDETEEDDTGEEQGSEESKNSQEQEEDEEEEIATEEEDSQPHSDEETLEDENTEEDEEESPETNADDESVEDTKETLVLKKRPRDKVSKYKSEDTKPSLRITKRSLDRLSNYKSIENKITRKKSIEKDIEDESESTEEDDVKQSNEDITKEPKKESNEEENKNEANQEEDKNISIEKSETHDEDPLEVVQLKESQKDEFGDNEKEPQMTEEKSGMSTKIGVGLALLVVAYKVFLQKRSTDNEAASPRILSENPDQPSDLSRRNTIIPPPTLEDIEADLNQAEDPGGYSEEEYSDEEYLEHQRSPREEYQELRTTYSRSITPEGDFVSKNLSKNEIEDIEDLDYAEEEYLEEEQSEEDIESPEEDNDDDDEELLKRLEAKYGKLGRDVTVPPDGADSDSDDKSEGDDYAFSNMSSIEGQKIKKQADEAQKTIRRNAALANNLFD